MKYEKYKNENNIYPEEIHGILKNYSSILQSVQFENFSNELNKIVKIYQPIKVTVYNYKTSSYHTLDITEENVIVAFVNQVWSRLSQINRIKCALWAVENICKTYGLPSADVSFFCEGNEYLCYMTDSRTIYINILNAINIPGTIFYGCIMHELRHYADDLQGDNYVLRKGPFTVGHALYEKWKHNYLDTSFIISYLENFKGKITLSDYEIANNLYHNCYEEFLAYSIEEWAMKDILKNEQVASYVENEDYKTTYMYIKNYGVEANGVISRELLNLAFKVFNDLYDPYYDKEFINKYKQISKAYQRATKENLQDK